MNINNMYSKRIHARAYIFWCGLTMFIYIGLFVTLDDPVLHPVDRRQGFITAVKKHTPRTGGTTGINADTDFNGLNSSCKLDVTAISAISRATSTGCKQQIADVACRIYKEELYPKRLPKLCPLKGLKAKRAPFVFNADEVRGTKSLRIVFVFTVTGRAVRQIRRLLKAIYHVDHYYYIHVDSIFAIANFQRADFLYRELLKLEKFTNIQLARERFATIWGGASRLQAHLSIMKTLSAMSNWRWDYYINLSETHYPIKNITALTKYLQQYQGYNFIQLTRTLDPRTTAEKNFVECDEHMWQLGMRKLPEGINFKIGPDWICLHRDFVEYAVTGTDPLLTGLKEMYKYTVSPVESFFHTLLHNSKFCDHWVNENMHITRWVTRLGCACQSHMNEVDWCGCSPMVLKQRDFDEMIVNVKRFPKFWSRKFDPIIDQEVLNSIDKENLGITYAGNQSIHRFWQKEYHYLDQRHSTSDLIETFAGSFIRRSLSLISKGDCGFPGVKLIETHILNIADTFDSYLVKFFVSRTGSDVPFILECRFSPIRHYEIYAQTGVIDNLERLEVGTNYDTKEELFRNYPGFFGPHSTGLTLQYMWKDLAGGNVTFLWVDPSGNTVSALGTNIGPRILSGVYKLETNSTSAMSPLLTGVWKLKVQQDGKNIAVLQFLVIPVLEGNDSIKQASRLPQIDSLTAQFWKAEDVCALEDPGSQCPYITRCSKTNWSSMSPDPKSDIIVDKNGNI